MRFVGTLVGMLLPVLGSPTAYGAGQDDIIRRCLFSSFAAWKEKDWKKVVENTHPEAKKSFKEVWAPVLEKYEKLSTFASYFPREHDLKSVLKMSPDEFYHTFLRWAGESDVMMRDFRTANVELVGSVYEGKNVVHAVVRFTDKVREGATIRMEVVSMKKDGEEWRWLLPWEIRNLIDQLYLRSKEKLR